MNIQMHGISRSGKNYLIEHLIKHFNATSPKTILFVKGSETLNKFSQERFGKPLSETKEEQKNELRRQFCPWFKKLTRKTEYKHIIVDGHYCFPVENDFIKSFSNEEMSIFDMFFYLDTPPKKIIENANNGDHNNHVGQFSIDKITKWKEIEIDGLQKTLSEIDKELIILDNDIDNIVSFFEYIFSHENVIFDARQIASSLIRKNQTLIEKYEKIILLDCDNTLSINDTTYEFCKTLKIDKAILKEILVNERYSLYQFYRIANLYSSFPLHSYYDSSEFAANRTILNDDLIKDITENGKEYLSIGITSGVLQTWKNIQKKHNFPELIIGGSNLKIEDVIISKFVKYQFTKLLRKKRKYVIAVGDSIIDMLMLEESDKGFIVANQKLNCGIEDYINNYTSISQLQYNKFKYKKIISKKSIFTME